ncbi:MAG: hypothetical protein NTY19_22420 [Planctomycetota bacterium]|nr:hypothetical protein [Planctomycetota bacterium]
MLDLQPLIDQVAPKVHAMLANHFHWPGNRRTTFEDAQAIAAISVATFVRGDCACADRWRPPLGRRHDFANAKQRCEREHGVRLQAVARHIAESHLAESRPNPFPLKLRADYLEHPLTAELSVDGIIHFQGHDFEYLSTATQAAKESVVGQWTDGDMKVFWSKRQNGLWMRADAAHLQPGSLPPDTDLRTDFLERAEFFKEKVLFAKVREDGVCFGEATCPGLTAAAEVALESVIKDREHTNGWRFWHYYEEKKSRWVRLDQMRVRFWNDWGHAVDPDAFWQSKTGSTRSLRETVQQATANAGAHAIPRLISFPFITYPDQRGADWGPVLYCARPIVTEFIYDEKQDRGTIQDWPRFVGELATAGNGTLGGWLWQMLLAEMEQDETDCLTQAVGADGAELSGSLNSGLKKRINTALNVIASRRELFDQFQDQADLRDLNQDVKMVLEEGIPAADAARIL